MQITMKSIFSPVNCLIVDFYQTAHQKIKDNLLVIYYLDRDN